MRARLALLAFSVVAGCGAGATPEAAAPTKASAALPAATQAPLPLPASRVSTLAGEKTDLGRVTEGKVALVSLWATWCEACQKEFEALNRLSDGAAKRSDAMVVGVAVGETAASVEAFRRERGLRYTQLVDEDFSFADALGQRRVPATLVVDRQGRIVYRGDVLDGQGLGAFRSALGDAR